MMKIFGLNIGKTENPVTEESTTEMDTQETMTIENVGEAVEPISEQGAIESELALTENELSSLAADHKELFNKLEETKNALDVALCEIVCKNEQIEAKDKHIEEQAAEIQTLNGRLESQDAQVTEAAIQIAKAQGVSVNELPTVSENEPETTDVLAEWANQSSTTKMAFYIANRQKIQDAITKRNNK